ncbi:ABC transporter ATP-binding protein [Flavobacterium sp.]|uniref:ABC transporter ATP-binding protein n=1 Tax=Flavobacterium sp. TaxID=239 RepID=UPI002FD94023
MKPFQLFHDIYAIIPENKKKSFRKLCYKSILFSLLDLISVAYLIPVLLVVLDKTKLNDFLLTYHLADDFLSPKTIGFGVLFLVVFFMVKNLLQTQFNSHLHAFLYGLSHEISSDILEKYLKGDYLYFQQQNKGNMIQNATTVARDFATCLLPSLLLLVSESLTFFVIIVVLLWCYFKLTLVALLAALLFAFIIYRIKKGEMHLINTTYKETASKANAELLNILEGYLEIKSSGNQDEFLNEFKKHNQKLNKVSSLLNASTTNYAKYLEVFLIIGIAMLVGYTYFFSAGNETLFLVAVLGALSIKIVPAMSKILHAITMINSYFYSVAILKNRPQPTKKVLYSDFMDNIEFKDINFSYNEKKVLFDHLNFTIKKGEIVGIKGITGVGKTTFLHIAAGLITPNKGSIIMDGDITKENPFFSFVSYVSQQPFLFNGTLLENITMRENPGTIDMDYVQYLMENLDLHSLITQLPGGLQTIITHNTSKLSGGQKQRLALARALYHKPQLLILDESTNQQNEELEILIYNLIREMAIANKMAVITVSHHSEMAVFCDRVYLLDKSKLTLLA